MIRPLLALTNADHVQQEVLRLRTALGVELHHTADVVQHGHDFERSRPVLAGEQRELALERFLGIGQLQLRQADPRQQVEVGGHFRMLAAVFLGQVDGEPQQRLGLGEAALQSIQPRQALEACGEARILPARIPVL